MDKHKLTTKRIARIAIFSAILFVQELALSFIPNVQFTQVLIAVYFASFGLFDTLAIVLIHCILDNLALGSFNLVYTPAMIVGWVSLVLILFIFRKVKNKTVIATIVALHSIIYSFCFLFINCFVLNTTAFMAYLIADLPFEIILIVNGFVTTYLLFDRLVALLNKLQNKTSD